MNGSVGSPTPRPRRVRRRAGAAGRMSAVELRGLRKSFGKKPAVAGIDLAVPEGSFFGLVGPNGAGKTTTLRMATGLLRPDSGTVIVDQIDVWHDPVTAKRRMGVLPEQLHLFDRLTGRELLIYAGLLHDLPADVVHQRADRLLRVLGLTDSAGTLVVDYSQGMRKKIGLAVALLHGPRVLFLDEPFESIDPVSARTIRQVLQQLTTSGATVIFSSHVMELVEGLCDRLAVINAGRVVAVGTVDEIRGAGRLDDAFVELVGAAPVDPGDLSWLGPSSD